MKTIDTVQKEKDHIFFTGSVLIPNEPDCDHKIGEKILSEEEVANISHEYMNYRILDKDHQYTETKKTIGTPVESWLLNSPVILENINHIQREYPKGTWMIKSKITDPESIEKVMNKTVAYSVTAISKDTAETLKSHKNKTLIKDLNNPVAYTVSLVEFPCVDNSQKMGETAIKKENENIINHLYKLIKDLIKSEKKIMSTKNKESKQDTSDKYVTKDHLKCFKNEIITLLKERDSTSNQISNKSKSLKNHDNETKPSALKSIEYYMGRDVKGRPTINKEE